MSAKEQKAKEYIQEKMFPHIANANTANAMAYFTSEDLKEAYTRGWDTALKNQWADIDKGEPKEFDTVVILVGCDRCEPFYRLAWICNNNFMVEPELDHDMTILAYMPIPSPPFDKKLVDIFNY